MTAGARYARAVAAGRGAVAVQGAAALAAAVVVAATAGGVAVATDDDGDVNVTGPEVFGPPGADVLQHLTAVADHLRTDWTQLPADLAEIDVHLERALGARSTVGSRYAQLETMRDRTDQDILLLRERLSEIEDIDLPATIVDLQLQETAYQAALSATARSVQPSLLDFLR